MILLIIREYFCPSYLVCNISISIPLSKILGIYYSFNKYSIYKQINQWMSRSQRMISGNSILAKPHVKLFA